MQISSRHIGRLVLLCSSLALVAAMGCARAKTATVLPDAPVFSGEGRELSFKEILMIINSQSQQVSTLSADVRIELKSEVFEKIQYCNAKLVLARPGKIRLKGFKAFVPTLFDIATNGREFWLYFPEDRKVYYGDYYRDDLWRPSPLDVDPAQLSQGLFIEGIAEGQYGQVVFVEKQSNERYVVYQADGWQTRHYIRRKIWVDGVNKRVVRQQYFVNDGNLSFEVRYQKYLNDIPLPQEILFYRPNTDSRAIIEVVSFRFNQKFPADLFELTEIQGAETIVVE